VYGRPSQIVSNNVRRFPSLILVHDGDHPHHLKVQLLRGSVREVRLLASHPDVVHRVTTPDGAVLCVVSRGSYPEFEELLDRVQAFSMAPPR
jgi:hypothetical protein